MLNQKCILGQLAGDISLSIDVASEISYQYRTAPVALPSIIELKQRQGAGTLCFDPC
jgi:hypothetical protein